jgi:hypothetical protein
VTLLIFRAKSSTFKRICHPDRSEAQSRYLLFLFRFSHRIVILRACDFIDFHVKSSSFKTRLSSRAQPICGAPRLPHKGLRSVSSPTESSSLSGAPSPIHRVIQRLWRGVEEPVLSVAEGTSAVLILPMPLGPSGPATFLPWGREPRTCCILLCPAPTFTFSAAAKDVPVTIQCVSQ